MRNSRKNFITRAIVRCGALLTLILLFVVGCGSHNNEQTQPGNNTYKHSMSGAPRSLDPIKAANKYANTAVLAVFDTLYTYKYLARPYEIKTSLAEALPAISNNGKTYTVKIKPGNFFHDHPSFLNGQGREVTAADFIYSMKRNFDPALNATGKWLWRDFVMGLQEWADSGADYDQPINGLFALDKYTIQINLIKPYPQLIHTLAMGYAAIVPREPAEYYGKEFGVNPVGSGPFIFESFDSEVAKFSRNTSFRQEPINLDFEGYESSNHVNFALENIDGKSPPFIDHLEIHFIKQSMSKWLSFNKGNEIQYSTIPPQLSHKVLQSQNPIKLTDDVAAQFNHSHNNELGFTYFGFNMQSEAFGYSDDPIQNEKNKMLRCAIRKAHDWSQRNDAFYFGIGNVFPGVIVPGTYDFDSNISNDSIIYDLAEAKRLLQQGAWGSNNLPPFEYHAVGSVENQRIYEQTRGFLMQLGYPAEKINFKQHVNFGALDKAVENGAAPFFFMGWNMDYPDAQNTLQLFYGPNKAPGSNKFSYDNKRYDELYEQALIMPESVERKTIFAALNQMVIDECVVISGINRTFISLWHKKVIFYPTEDITGASFLKYVAIKNNEE